MKGAFRFRSSSLLLTSHSLVRPHKAMPCRQALLRQTDQTSRKGICSLQAQWRTVPRSQRLLAFPCYLSLMAAFWFSSHQRQTNCLLTGLSTAQETAGRKQWRFPTSLGFLSCPQPQGRLSLATYNSPAH